MNENFNINHQCDICGKIMSSRENILEDGREICGNCYQTGVRETKTLKRLMFIAKNHVEEITGLRVKIKIELKMMNAYELNKALSNKIEFTSKFDNRYCGYCLIDYSESETSREINKINIYIENFYSADKTIQILIHELAHAIYGIYKKGDFDEEESEGFARWLEYKYLRRYKDNKEKNSFVNSNYYHRDAFIEILKIDSNEGISGVIEKIIK